LERYWRRRDDVPAAGAIGDQGHAHQLELMMELLAGGYTAEQIIAQYEHLTREDIQACLGYAKELVQT
jgi:uncharacterized protein (DUF433 family)